MKIDCVTFTGADDKTDLDRMNQLSNEFPFIEWGVLISKSKMGLQRYPSLETLILMNDALKHTNRSTHICGSICKDIVEDGGINPDDINLFSEAVKYANRIQLNFSIKSVKLDLMNLGRFINRIQDKKFILQQNKSNAPLIDGITPFLTRSSKVQILFDASGGRGTEITDIPNPILNLHCGYAGGLNADNLEAKIKEIDQAVLRDREIWLDMENGVRTNNEFDLSKVRKCCEIIQKFI